MPSKAYARACLLSGLLVCMILVWHFSHPRRRTESLPAHERFEHTDAQNWSREPQVGLFDQKPPNWTFIPARDAENLGLSHEQCSLAFPKLYVEIEESKSRRKAKPISRKEIDEYGSHRQSLRAMIHDNKLYIIKDNDDITASAYQTRTRASLSSINRALVSSSNEPLPDIEFIISPWDYWPRGEDPPIWSLARRQNETTTWLMPDFGFWAYPETHVGGYDEVRHRIREVEASISRLEDKDPRIVWRGNPGNSPDLRGDLLHATYKKAWADVKVLHWDDPNDLEKNRISMEDHCRYRYVAHTEGASYSARLKYILNCQSIPVVHKMEYIQHFHHLLVAEGQEQNMLQTERDWSDLEYKIGKLEEDSEAGARIVENAVATFRDRYLTPAAEMCYWKRLIRAWAEVSSFKPMFYEDHLDAKGKKIWRGVPWETYSLMLALDWNIE